MDNITLFQEWKIRIVKISLVFIFKNDEVKGEGANCPPSKINKLAKYVTPYSVNFTFRMKVLNGLNNAC